MANKRFGVISFEFPGEPLTKSNQAKWFRGYLYIPKRIIDYEAALHRFSIKIMKQEKKHPTKNLVKVEIEYYLGSKRRKDIQNLTKSTLDAFNDAIYKDDSQVHDLHIKKMIDRENPRIRVTIEEMSNKQWEQA